MRMSPFMKFWPPLRLLGFRKAYASEAGGAAVRIYERQATDDRVPRKVIVQIWSDGQHRASHSISGRETTPPTTFTTIAEMHEAIRHETEHMDHRLGGPVPESTR